MDQKKTEFDEIMEAALYGSFYLLFLLPVASWHLLQKKKPQERNECSVAQKIIGVSLLLIGAVSLANAFMNQTSFDCLEIGQLKISYFYFWLLIPINLFFAGAIAVIHPLISRFNHTTHPLRDEIY